MHEAGIVEDLIKSIRERIGEGKSGRLKKIYVQLGKATGVSEDSLKFWFEDLSRGTELGGVSLDVTVVPGKQITVDSLEVE